MMTIYAKLLNGDLLSIALPQGASVSLLKSQLHTVLLEAPLGSLVLHHFLPEVDDADEATQLMLMGEALTADVRDHSFVSELFDEMVVVVLVDPTLIQPSVVKKSTIHAQAGSYSGAQWVPRKGWIQTLDRYQIDFHHTTEMVEEDSNVLLSVCVVHNIDTDQWALASSFEPIIEHWECTYRPTLRTQWCSEPSVCLLQVPERIPRNHQILAAVQHIFDYEEWEDEGFDWDEAPDHDQEVEGW